MYLLLIVILIWCIIWLFNYVTCGVCKSTARMDGKTVIITGCDSGLGKATAFDLARRGARVIMACVRENEALLVKESIIEATKNNNIVVKKIDLSLMSSVRKFAEEINRTEKRLDVLIHNAGIYLPGRHVTEEGLNLTWAVNFFGPFLLTHLLIDLLKSTGNSRIVVVSSFLHYFGGVDLDNPNPVEESSGVTLYCTTKFAIVLFTNEVARRLKEYGVTANSLHPGGIYTPIWNNNPTWVLALANLIRPFFKTVEQGAQTTIHLAVSEELEGVSGKYFADCQEWAPAKKTRDVSLAKKYWEVCEKIVELQPSDPHI